MTYHTDNRIRKYVKDYGFLLFAIKFGSKYGKKLANKGILASKTIKIAAKKFNQNKYGQVLKREGSKIGKLAGKQLPDKIIHAAVDLGRSKIADKIISLKGEEPQEELEEEQEIIIPPHQRQKIID